MVPGSMERSDMLKRSCQDIDMCLIFSCAELVPPGYPLAEPFWSSEPDIEVWNWIKIACVCPLPPPAALCLEVTATMVLEGVCLTEPVRLLTCAGNAEP